MVKESGHSVVLLICGFEQLIPDDIMLDDQFHDLALGRRTPSFLYVIEADDRDTQIGTEFRDFEVSGLPSAPYSLSDLAT